MHAIKVVNLLFVVAALGWTTNCSLMQNTAREESTPPAVPSKISQEMLNSLIRQNSQATQPVPKAKMWAHEIRHRRETLFSIALWYTGSGENWHRLAEANPDIDPKRIRIGDTILIPEELLKTRHPIPANFPKPEHKRRKFKKPHLPNIHPPIKSEETTLFGPIVNDSQTDETENSDLPVPLETID